jgi:hypothetical protein
VHWDLLQPLKPVPRGREAMTAAQWGSTRDADGVCTICGADDSMWCDQAVHWPYRRKASIEHTVTINVKSPGFEARCLCGWAQEATTVYVAQAAKAYHIEEYADVRAPTPHAVNEVAPTPQIASPPARVRPPDTFSLAACTGEMIDQRSVSQLARELWAADLAELVRKGEAQDQDRERNRVLVDLEFEPWE